jgi:hypothetical protein
VTGVGDRRVDLGDLVELVAQPLLVQAVGDRQPGGVKAPRRAGAGSANFLWRAKSVWR